jgi:hypothetical protein
VKLIRQLYVSARELKHAYPAQEAIAQVKQSLENREVIDGMDELRRSLMVDDSSELLDQIERGEWLLIKAQASFFDWGQFAEVVSKKQRDQRIMELMKSPLPQPKTPLRIFRIVDSETGEPLTHRSYIATVDGQKTERRTDSSGVTHISAPPEGAKISMQVIGS